MIGNDVVDLRLATRQSKWRRKGFLNKVFSAAEQEVITTSKNPDVIVWLLWSMKEAVYKAHQRQFDLPRRLNWLVYQCQLSCLTTNSALGTVKVSGHSYSTTSEITPEYIYTSTETAAAPGAKNLILQVSSSAAKEQLISDISAHYKVEAETLLLKKDPLGMPFLSGNSSFYFNLFSLSGHGRFYAYSLSLINCETPVKQS